MSETLNELFRVVDFHFKEPCNKSVHTAFYSLRSPNPSERSVNGIGIIERTAMLPKGGERIISVV